MLEPAVTLTDYAITLECLVLSLLLVRKSPRSLLRNHSVLFFLSIGTASLMGGTVHGFFPASLWLRQLTLVAIGVTSLAMWRITALIVPNTQWQKAVELGANALFLFYVAVVIFISQDFLIAILVYLPPAICLLLLFGITFVRERSETAKYGALGILLSLVSSAMQQLKIGVHPVFFDHNAIYHILQGVSLWLMYLCFGRLAQENN